MPHLITHHTIYMYIRKRFEPISNLTIFLCLYQKCINPEKKIDFSYGWEMYIFEASLEEEGAAAHDEQLLGGPPGPGGGGGPGPQAQGRLT